MCEIDAMTIDVKSLITDFVIDTHKTLSNQLRKLNFFAVWFRLLNCVSRQVVKIALQNHLRCNRIEQDFLRAAFYALCV